MQGYRVLRHAWAKGTAGMHVCRVLHSALRVQVCEDAQALLQCAASISGKVAITLRARGAKVLPGQRLETWQWVMVDQWPVLWVHASGHLTHTVRTGGEPLCLGGTL